MRSLNPAGPDPSKEPTANHLSKNSLPQVTALQIPASQKMAVGIEADLETALGTETVPRTKATDIASAVAPHSQPASPSAASYVYRFRTDSWLSVEDANFLLKKRAQWQAHQNNYVAAIQVLNKLVAFEPDKAEHYANRGLMYSHIQSWEKALADYDCALAINPELDSAYNNRANLHAKKQDWAEAIFDYDNAIDINPLNIRARLNQAITFREMENYEEALACLDVALFFRPDSALLYAERGQTYHVRGDWNCALADYNTATTLTQSPVSDTSNRRPLCNPEIVNQRVKRWLKKLH